MGTVTISLLVTLVLKLFIEEIRSFPVNTLDNHRIGDNEPYLCEESSHIKSYYDNSTPEISHISDNAMRFVEVPRVMESHKNDTALLIHNPLNKENERKSSNIALPPLGRLVLGMTTHRVQKIPPPWEKSCCSILQKAGLSEAENNCTGGPWMCCKLESTCREFGTTSNTTFAPSNTTLAPSNTTLVPSKTTLAPSDTTLATTTTAAPVTTAQSTSDTSPAGLVTASTEIAVQAPQSGGAPVTPTPSVESSDASSMQEPCISTTISFDCNASVTTAQSGNNTPQAGLATASAQSKSGTTTIPPNKSPSAQPKINSTKRKMKMSTTNHSTKVRHDNTFSVSVDECIQRNLDKYRQCQSPNAFKRSVHVDFYSLGNLIKGSTKRNESKMQKSRYYDLTKFFPTVSNYRRHKQKKFTVRCCESETTTESNVSKITVGKTAKNSTVATMSAYTSSTTKRENKYVVQTTSPTTHNVEQQNVSSSKESQRDPLKTVLPDIKNDSSIVQGPKNKLSFQKSMISSRKDLATPICDNRALTSSSERKTSKAKRTHSPKLKQTKALKASESGDKFSKNNYLWGSRNRPDVVRDRRRLGIFIPNNYYLPSNVNHTIRGRSIFGQFLPGCMGKNLKEKDFNKKPWEQPWKINDSDLQFINELVSSRPVEMFPSELPGFMTTSRSCPERIQLACPSCRFNPPSTDNRLEQGKVEKNLGRLSWHKDSESGYTNSKQSGPLFGSNNNILTYVLNYPKSAKRNDPYTVWEQSSTKKVELLEKVGSRSKYYIEIPYHLGEFIKDTVGLSLESERVDTSSEFPPSVERCGTVVSSDPRREEYRDFQGSSKHRYGSDIQAHSLADMMMGSEPKEKEEINFPPFQEAFPFVLIPAYIPVESPHAMANLTVVKPVRKTDLNSQQVLASPAELSSDQLQYPSVLPSWTVSPSNLEVTQGVLDKNEKYQTSTPSSESFPRDVLEQLVRHMYTTKNSNQVLPKGDKEPLMIIMHRDMAGKEPYFELKKMSDDISQIVQGENRSLHSF